jgi:hypothetical protein
MPGEARTRCRWHSLTVVGKGKLIVVRRLLRRALFAPSRCSLFLLGRGGDFLEKD